MTHYLPTCDHLVSQSDAESAFCTNPTHKKMGVYRTEADKMSDSIAYKTLLACFDKLVLALKLDPVTISNELVAANLFPPPDGNVEAQQLAQRILDIVKVEPARYDDVMKVLSKHNWLRDIGQILETAYSEWSHRVLIRTSE